MTCFGEAECQGKSNVSASNDSDLELSAFEEFRSSIRCHVVEIAPRSFLVGSNIGPEAKGANDIFTIAASVAGTERSRIMYTEFYLTVQNTVRILYRST
jgi:hypothetical protein